MPYPPDSPEPEDKHRAMLNSLDGQWIERCVAEQRGVSQTLTSEAVAVELLPAGWQPETGEQLIEQRQLYDALCEGLDCLPYRSWTVLRERYGLAGAPLTLEQIAEQRGVSRPTVARWLVVAHAKLERALRMQASNPGPPPGCRPAPRV